MKDEEYWEWRVDTAQSKEEFDSAMDGLMSNMVDQGLVSMGWSEESEEIVFFMTDEQAKEDIDLELG
tara:strand:+ start:83 stop:283 length:201 start_codon:yes stop_codon:yes gene_type:complete